jgi:hypothetical protein
VNKLISPPLPAPRFRLRKGMVLVTAILAVLLMTAILASVFFATIEHTRAGLATSRREAAIEDAERALGGGVDRLALSDFDAPPIGGSVSASDAAVGRTVVYITRLDSILYSVVADVAPTSSDAGASIRIGGVVERSVDAQHAIHVVRIPGHAWSQLF